MAIRPKQRYFTEPELVRWVRRSHGDGALDAKTKHLIHLAVALALKCEPCVVQELDDLAHLGVTAEEVGEVVQCAASVGAGTMLAMASRAADASDAGYRWWEPAPARSTSSSSSR